MFEGIGLFWGALLDALIGPNLFVPGEPFFIAAGYQLHNGVWLGVAAVLLGGLLGDQLSYLIGYKVGAKAQRKLMHYQPKSRRTIARCRYLMAKKGNYVIAFARLLGPVAWVVPFIAGTNKTPWARFSALASIGLIIGGSQFIFWGYLLAYGVEQIPLLNEARIFVIEHQYTLISLLVTIVFAYVGYKQKWRLLAVKVASLFLAFQLWTNYGHFFWLSDDFKSGESVAEVAPKQPSTPIESYKAYAGKSAFFDAQAMNVMYVGDTPLTMMKNLGWIENQTFSRNEIELKDYLNLLKDKTPPVSDLFWQERPQDMAFQLPGSLMKRSHIRWWKSSLTHESGQPVWMGAISYDNGLKITPYSGIITVLHSINPDVDEERDRLAKNIEQTFPELSVTMEPLTLPVALDSAHDYYSDGRVLVIDSETDFSQELVNL